MRDVPGKFLSVALVVASLLLAACGGAPGGDGDDPSDPTDPGNSDVTSVTIIEPPSSEVQKGGAIDLNVTVEAEAGVATTVTWESSSPDNATVDNNGLVTGVEAGSTTITAISTADTDVSDSITITVLDGTVTNVTIADKPSGNSLFISTDVDLSASVEGTGNFSQDVFWTSSAPGVATVDGDGLVSAVAEGTTVIEATSASDFNVSDTFTLTVISASVDCSAAESLPTTINSATTLPLGCYRASSNVTVSADLVFTAGSIIEVEQNNQINVEAGGSLKAQGTAVTPIIFRGLNPSAGYWEGIRFASLSENNVLEHVQISDAGCCFYDANVYVESSGSVSLTNSSLSNSSEYGLEVVNGGELSAFANNTFAGNRIPVFVGPDNIGTVDGASTFEASNTENFIDVRGGIVEAVQTWRNAGTPFRFTGDVDVSRDVTVEPGAAFAFADNVQLDVVTGGSLNAVGTATDPIKFFGAAGSPGSWEGLRFDTASAKNVLTYTEVTDAGCCFYDANVYVERDASLSLTNSMVSNSSEYGLYASGGDVLSDFASNTFSDNKIPVSILAADIGKIDGASSFADSNDENFIDVRGGTTDATQTWDKTTAPFRFTNDLDIDSAVTVEAGANVTISQNVQLDVLAGGSLNANGTAGETITFTGENNSAWEGIRFVSNSTDNVLNFVTVAYGGCCFYDANIYIDGGRLVLTNSTISNSETRGLVLQSGSIIPGTQTALTDVNDGNNTFSDNAGENIVGIPIN